MVNNKSQKINVNHEKSENITEKFKGIWIPVEIWRCKELSFFEKCLWAQIGALQDSENGEWCWAGNRYFMNLFGVQLRVLQRALANLKARKLIKMVMKNKTQRYLWANFPDVKDVNKVPKGVSKMTWGGVKNDMGGVSKMTPIKQRSKTKIKIKGESMHTQKSVVVKSSLPSPISHIKHTEKMTLAPEKYQDLCQEFGKKRVDNIFGQIAMYELEKGKIYKNYYATARKWLLKDDARDSKNNPSIEDQLQLLIEMKKKYGKHPRLNFSSDKYVEYWAGGQATAIMAQVGERDFVNNMKKILIEINRGGKQ